MSYLIEQLRKFSEAAEGLREDISEDELSILTTNIKDHIDDILEYVDAVEDDAQRLKMLAKKYSDAARTQENKALRIKEHVKFALKSQGFTKFSTEKNRITLSSIEKIVPRRPATIDDALLHPTVVIPSLKWKGEPPLTIVDQYPDLVEFDYSWDIVKLKESGIPSLIETKTIDRLTVGVAKS
jgi:hypothetical protein